MLLRALLLVGAVVSSSQAFGVMCINWDVGEFNGKYYYSTFDYGINPTNDQCERTSEGGYFECDSPLDISVNGVHEMYMCYEQMDELFTCSNNYPVPTGCTPLL
jgi:hypothetical protein